VDEIVNYRNSGRFKLESKEINTFVKLIIKHQDVILAYALKTIGVLFLLWLTFKIANALRNGLSKVLLKRGFDSTISIALGGMLRLLIIAASIISILGVFGVNTASFAAVLASVGLAIGLALQGALGNFASGIMLLIFRPFKAGDLINVSGEVGSVVEIDLCNVTLDTPDNRRVIVPNNLVFGGVIENMTHHRNRRVDVTIGVSYDADIDKTRGVFKKVLENLDLGLKNPEPVILLSNLGESSVDWVLRVYCKTADYWVVRDSLLDAAKKSLESENIEIPYPHVNVKFDKQIVGLLTNK
jgi:small conductance mechanosensitive channel